MKHVMTRILIGLALPLALAVVATAAEKAPADKSTDPSAMCAEMMKNAEASSEGGKAMREFMQSDRTPQAMTNMMEMARKMGNGDVMLGMTRMMEMMGSMGSGGMMGGSSGMTRPDGAKPGK
jgi:flagellar biosynthesis protein FliP